jgi:hypothetical protein
MLLSGFRLTLKTFRGFEPGFNLTSRLFVSTLRAMAEIGCEHVWLGCRETSNFKTQNPAVAAPKRRFDAPRRREFGTWSLKFPSDSFRAIRHAVIKD